MLLEQFRLVATECEEAPESGRSFLLFLCYAPIAVAAAVEVPPGWCHEAWYLRRSHPHPEHLHSYHLRPGLPNWDSAEPVGYQLQCLACPICLGRLRYESHLMPKQLQSPQVVLQWR